MSSRTGAKYSPHHRCGTKRDFNSGCISVTLMAVATRRDQCKTGSYRNSYVQFHILIFRLGISQCTKILHFSNQSFLPENYVKLVSVINLDDEWL